MIRSFLPNEEGQSLVEYALILVLIATVVIGILTLLGGKVSQVFGRINSGLKQPRIKNRPQLRLGAVL